MAFKITSVKTRFFEFENPDNGQIIYVEPPKMKTLKALEDIQKDKGTKVMDVACLVARLLSKNKRSYVVSPDKVLAWMDLDQMQAFLQAFMTWLSDARSNDPN